MKETEYLFGKLTSCFSSLSKTNLPNINDLKAYSYSGNKNEPKKLLNIYNIMGENYEMSILSNFLTDKQIYEVYLCYETTNDIASNLLYKTFTNKLKATIYYNFLKRLTFTNNPLKILKILSK